MFLNWIFSFIVALNSNKNPQQVSLGIAYGFMLALIPFGSLTWTICFILPFLLVLNQGAMILALLLFSFFAYMLDPILNYVGNAILTAGFLEPVFTRMINIPIVPLTSFNNTLVMGGLVVGLILLYPLTIIFNLLLLQYRRHIRDRIARMKVFVWFKNLKLVNFIIVKYQKVGQKYQEAKQIF